MFVQTTYSSDDLERELFSEDSQNISTNIFKLKRSEIVYIVQKTNSKIKQ